MREHAGLETIGLYGRNTEGHDFQTLSIRGNKTNELNATITAHSPRDLEC